MRYALAAVLMLGVVACRSRDDLPVVERRTVGDTTIVRTVSRGVWGDTARLVEELRIGSVNGPPELAFGWIDALAVGPDGVIHVYDGQAVAVRTLDSTGAFVRSIGRHGEGPGEYSSVSGLRVLPDGRIALWDPDNRRVTLYSAAGVPTRTIRVPAPAMPSPGKGLALDSAGHLYVLTRRAATNASGNPVDRHGAPPADVLVRIDSTGVSGDSIAVPTWPSDDQRLMIFAPKGHWTFHPHGHFVAGWGNRYSFDVRYRDGRVLRVQRAVEPVEVRPEERAELEASLAGTTVFMPSAPNGAALAIEGNQLAIAPVKPMYRNIIADADGRIWVHLHTEATKTQVPDDTSDALRTVWREPSVYDVFDADGRYLGPVAVPVTAEIMFMRGEHVWGTTRGVDDETSVVRWWLVTPGAKP